MSWFEAETFCKSIGAKLVEIDSRGENAAIVAEIDRRGYKERSMFFWIGLTDLNREGTWKLASEGKDPHFLNWDKSHTKRPEPNNFGGNEHCAHIRDGICRDWIGAWADLDCNENTLEITLCDNSGSIPFVEVSMHALCEFESACQTNSSDAGDYLECVEKFY